MTGTVDIHALAGAYALDAVDDIERAAFDRHLRDCPSCVVEVAEMRETTAWLAQPVAEAPPPRMREAVLTQIRGTPQERERRTTAAAGRANRGRLLRWAVSGVAAAVLAAGAGVGTWVVAEQQIAAERAAQANIDAVLAAADARLVKQEVQGGHVNMVVSPARNAAVAVLDGLTAPGADKDYQVWMIDPDTTSYRNVGQTAKGSGRFYIQGLAPVFGVSVEKAGSKPKTPNQVVGRLDIR
ncbi:anti-sigma factor [Dactylosporangium darangshiense]|uniref:Regulator of SigK n=1 Tax=Dactylosporangium darangshiense TaxID=579108 RepID=A0ABP8CUG8_9ACTN